MCWPRGSSQKVCAARSAGDGMTTTQANPILLDGSYGEGGGQILRTALGLSALTGKPFAISKIRAGRKKPGLLRQHLACVKAATAICAAEVRSAEIGSTELTFTPREVMAGRYHFAVGSAGSSTLVLQTILPPLLLATGESVVSLEGGTHNPFAPPVDFLMAAFLPIVKRMGGEVDVAIERCGFFPAGGGRWTATIRPAKKLSPITLNERGEPMRRLAKAIVADLPGEIAKRELERVEKRLGWHGDQLQIRQLPQGQGPGNALMLTLESEHVTEVCTSFGERGVSAENVGDGAVEQMRQYLTATAPVGEHLADQLLIPFALAGSGSFTALKASLHTMTNIDVIRRFLGVHIEVSTQPSGECRISFTTN